MGLTSFISNL